MPVGRWERSRRRRSSVSCIVMTAPSMMFVSSVYYTCIHDKCISTLSSCWIDLTQKNGIDVATAAKFRDASNNLLAAENTFTPLR